MEDLLARHGQVYLRHVELCLFRQDSAYPLPEDGALEHFLWDLRGRVIDVIADIGLESLGEVHYQLLPGQYGPGQTRLQILLMMTQQAFQGLGNEEQSAEEVLEELLCDSWAGIQRVSCLHPVWLTSRIRGVGSAYLSNERRDQGAAALSAMLAFCFANSRGGSSNCAVDVD
jgi:hypothetical protein